MSWCKDCPYLSKGRCRMAAELAGVAVNHAPVTESVCLACKSQTEPTPDLPNNATAFVALKALMSQFPQKASRFKQKWASVFRTKSPQLTATHRESPAAGVPAYTTADFPCVHRSPDFSREHQCTPCDGGQLHPVHWCHLKRRECTVLSAPKALDSRDGSRVEFCIACDKRQAEIPPEPEPPPPPHHTYQPRSMRYIVTAEGRHCGEVWANRFKGQSVFLVCSGPSLQTTNLELLNQRGLATAAINNAAAVIRPTFAFMSDPPSKFHQSIFADPGIAVFLKSDMLGKHTRNPVGTKANGEPTFENAPPANSYPNVWGFERDGSVEFEPSEFFTSQRPRWAVSEPGFNKRSTMLSALRILVDLGFTTIYLVGCDFNMTPDNPYGFRDKADQRKCESNNRLYRIMQQKFVALRPVLEAGGIRVVNCTPGGNLEAFERMPLEDAVSEALKPVKPVESLYGHYWVN